MTRYGSVGQLQVVERERTLCYFRIFIPEWLGNRSILKLVFSHTEKSCIAFSFQYPQKAVYNTMLGISDATLGQWK